MYIDSRCGTGLDGRQATIDFDGAVAHLLKDFRKSYDLQDFARNHLAVSIDDSNIVEAVKSLCVSIMAGRESPFAVTELGEGYSNPEWAESLIHADTPLTQEARANLAAKLYTADPERSQHASRLVWCNALRASLEAMGLWEYPKDTDEG
jgi:hypothetical protein